jgi:hypothetical protein
VCRSSSLTHPERGRGAGAPLFLPALTPPRALRG